MPAKDTFTQLSPHGASTETRFWSSIICDTATGCWLWTGQKNRYGYGMLWMSRQYTVLEQTSDRMVVEIRAARLAFAHRYAYELLIGPIPNALLVCHHCDIRNCVRPEHLFVGTAAQNNLDMMQKGRHRTGRGPVYRGDEWRAKYGGRVHDYPRGEAHVGSILTEADVRAIKARRRNGELLRVLAAEYGVHLSLIGKIMAGKNWAHLD